MMRPRSRLRPGLMMMVIRPKAKGVKMKICVEMLPKLERQTMKMTLRSHLPLNSLSTVLIHNLEK